MASDLANLMDMGFEKERAVLAISKSGGLQQALEWLEKHQDESLQQIQETDIAAETDPHTEAPELKTGEVAKSLICNECGRKLRSHQQAEFHASKTSHVDFSESVEEIAPLTEEEKKARLEELRKKVAEKRAEGSEQDQKDVKRNEEIRRKSTKATQDIKEDLQKKEQMKEAAAKRKDKEDEIAAKHRIMKKIAADKEERRSKSEKEKAQREGRTAPTATASQTKAPTPGSMRNKPASAYAEARLRLQLPTTSIQKAFPVDTTLAEVASAVGNEVSFEITSFTQNYPKRVFSGIDFGQTLKEAGLVPSASLIAK